MSSSGPSALPLLVSHAFTKFGSKGWEFATPLLLLQFSPDGSLFAPTAFGLSITVIKLCVGPAIGRCIDAADRMHIVRLGVGLQVVGVLCALGVLGLLWLLAPPSSDAAIMPLALLIAMIACGTAEMLGALISSVAVKKDWVPAIWTPDDPALAAVNANMANIDLIAEIVGPLAAGLVMQLLGDTLGFVAIGITNAITFGIELQLLNIVYRSNSPLQRPKPVADAASESKFCGRVLSAWPIFLQHPSGIPLLVISCASQRHVHPRSALPSVPAAHDIRAHVLHRYALLYFTVLSPHGVILTAYLQTQDLSPVALSAFRAAGALAGVGGMRAFKVFSGPLGLRRVATAHLWLLAVVVALAAFSFNATHAADGLSMPMITFLSMVVVSRFGCAVSTPQHPRPLPLPMIATRCHARRLYGFDLAVLQLQQVMVDEAHRGAVGAIESSLCSLGTGSLLLATLLTSTGSAQSFDGLVYVSAGCVGSAAVTYTCWVALFREHAHSHPLFDESSVHKHTTQQLRALDESGAARTHSHTFFLAPWKRHAHEVEHALPYTRSHTHA